MNFKIKNVGFDIHGCINANPTYFVGLADFLHNLNAKVHIITGVLWSKAIEAELLYYNNGIKWWDEFFSITDYLLELNIPYCLDESNRCIFDSETWNKQKAEYCKRNFIDLHIDDTERYYKYFDTSITKFILFKNSC
jgi:hypothetical protein